MLIYILIVLILIIFILILKTYNELIKLSNNVEEAFSIMNVYLLKRWELVPNLIEIVKSYTNHEQDTLIKVTNLKQEKYNEMNINEKVEVNEKISEGISEIITLSENYPKLKANNIFYDLYDKLVKIEDDIANARKYYNGTVKKFNDKVQMFPSNIVANILKYKPKKMYEAKKEKHEKNNIKI